MYTSGSSGFDNSLAWSLGAAVSLAAVVAVHQYYKNKFSYWTRRGIKGPRPWPIMGNTVSLFGNKRRQIGAEWRIRFGKVFGIYEGSKPSLMVADPEVLRQICIKDFDVFPNHDTDFFISELQENFIIFTRDERWRDLRARLSPTFTSGKMRRMYKLMERCADDLLDSFGEHFDKPESSKDGALVHLKNTFNLYTMDAIASCCYGIKLERQKSVNDLKTAANRNEFVRLARGILEFRPMRTALYFALGRRLQELFDFKLSPESDLRPFANLVQQIIDRRKRDSSRNFDDYLHILLDLGSSSSADDAIEPDDLDSIEQHHAGATDSNEKLQYSDNGFKLNNIEILSSATMLLAVGLETTSTLLTHCTYALAYNKHVQDKLYQEVKKIAIPREYGGFVFEYRALTSCNYLDSVLSETLRLLGPAIQLDRVASRDYHIEKYNISLPKGSKVTLNLVDTMLDEEFWPEPHKFDPERFMPENRHKIVPGSYLPFGMGPRHCLGMRFALTEAKLALAKLSMEFEFSPAPGKQFPPEFKLNNIREPLVRVHKRL